MSFPGQLWWCLHKICAVDCRDKLRITLQSGNCRLYSSACWKQGACVGIVPSLICLKPGCPKAFFMVDWDRALEMFAAFFRRFKQVSKETCGNSKILRNDWQWDAEVFPAWDLFFCAKVPWGWISLMIIHLQICNRTSIGDLTTCAKLSLHKQQS